MAEARTDTESVEETIFHYSSDGEGDGGQLWLAGDIEPRETFDFRITNARVAVETPGGGETAIPLPFLSTVRTNTSEEEHVTGQRLLKYASLSILGVIALFTIAAAILGSPWEAIFAGGFWLVIWFVVGGKIEDILTYTDEWRQFEFTADPESDPRTIKFRGLKPEYDPDDMSGEFKLRIPKEDFTRTQLNGIDIDQSSLVSEKEQYALLAALFRGVGVTVDTLEPVNISLTSDTVPVGEGGYQGGSYVCENCGNRMADYHDMDSTGDLKCGECGYKLDDQSAARTINMFDYSDYE